MGLATTLSIVQQHKGWITVESALGQGTTFKLFFPIATAARVGRSLRAEQAAPSTKESIFIIEDDPNVRDLVAKSLHRLGYRVHSARNATEALEVWPGIEKEIDLVLTDMVLPEATTGLELIQKFRQTKPGLPGLVFSGYSVDTGAGESSSESDVGFIDKPFHIDDLNEAIRRRLKK